MNLNTFEEMNIRQNKITPYLQDILTEWNQFRNLANKLETKFTSLWLDFSALKKENIKLKEDSEKSKFIIAKCINQFSTYEKSTNGKVEDLRPLLESLKGILMNDAVNEENFSALITNNKDAKNFLKPEPPSIERKQFALKNNDVMMLEASFEVIPKCNIHRYETDKSEKRVNVQENQDDCYCIETCQINDSQIERSSREAECPSTSGMFRSSKILDKCRSPLSNTSTKEKENENRGKSVEATNDGKSNFDRCAQILVSPLKRKSDDLDKRKNSPKRWKIASSTKQISAKEFNTADSGSRKLMQTLLNVNFLKRSNTNKLSADLDEDDFIWESPRYVRNVDKSKFHQKENVESSGDVLRVDKSGVIDPDETFIPAEVKENSTAIKQEKQEEKFYGTSFRTRSPEYDSVPFFTYDKQEKPKKKGLEEQKVEGRTCLHCEKYYREAYGDEGDVDSAAMKKVMEKCSRHRNPNRLNVPDTPPGYWKPYLTVSPNSTFREE